MLVATLDAVLAPDAPPPPSSAGCARQRALAVLARIESRGAASDDDVHPRLVHLTRLEHRPVRAPASPSRWPTPAGGSPTLTTKQRGLLHLVEAEGGVTAAAARLGTSRGNVYAGLRRIVHRLGVRDTGELLRLVGSGDLLRSAPIVTAYRRAVAPWLTRARRASTISRPARGWSSAAPAAPTRSRCSRSPRARDLDVVAVYVDHGLRAGTDARRARRARRGRRRSAPRRASCAVEVDASANLEARARDARYAALERAADDAGAAAILVGHTRDDQAETVLLALLRGSGTAGLAGMPAVRGRVRRPLLDAAARRHARDLRPAAVGAGARSDERRAAPPAGVAAARGDPAARARRAARSRRGARPPGRGAARRRRAARRARGRARARRRGRARRVAARARAGASSAGGSARRRPRSATVDAVLDGRARRAPRGRAPGGRRVERVGARLHLVDGARSRRRRRAGGAGAARSGPVRLGRRRGVDRGRAAGRVARRPALRGRRRRPGRRRRRPCGSRAPASGSGRSAAAARSSCATRSSRRASRRAGARHAPIVSAGPDAAVPADSALWVVGYRIDDRVRVTSRTRRYLWMSVEPC